ncbi:SulP family inorganic anion transporter [Streptomyces sp. ME02-8801-2C]|uniref:SulP family inorganic anion transporter n=1 Tax=Streptomyces sp. ME02-8801-2C TaxID=3028680 RepID=UPI0039F6BC39
MTGLPPVAGLWAILPALALYALLGSSRLLSVGPESTTALMAATVIGPLAAGDPARYATPAATLAIRSACCACWNGRHDSDSSRICAPGWSSPNCVPSQCTCHRSTWPQHCSPSCRSGSSAQWRISSAPSPPSPVPCSPWSSARLPCPC